MLSITQPGCGRAKKCSIGSIGSIGAMPPDFVFTYILRQLSLNRGISDKNHSKCRNKRPGCSEGDHVWRERKEDISSC
jgi:hypothetical protein